jgi:transcriptional regulator of acetoin/glycerol metabolism
VEWKRPGAPLELPASDVGALILQDVGGLGAAEQTRLLMWLATASQHTQIVSTTVHSLFALVARGLFDEALYYHLNLVLLQVDFRDRPEPAHQGLQSLSGLTGSG